MVKVRFPALAKAMKRLDIAWELLDLTAPGFEEALAERLARQPAPDAILGIGGDGTHFSMVNSLKRLQKRQPETALPPYAICPFGTGNDIAKSLGIKPGRWQYPKIMRTAVAGEDRRLDLGTFEDQYFVDMVSLGLDARILGYRDKLTNGVQRLPLVKRLIHGYTVYAVATLYGFLTNRRWHCEISVDGKPWFEGKICGALINNCPIHAGEFELTPGARPDDGKLDLLVIPGLIRYAAHYLRGWRYQPGFIRRYAGPRLTQARHIHIKTQSPIPVQRDGEFYEPRTELVIGIEPGAITFKTPKA